MICAVIQHPCHCVKYHGTNAATSLGNHSVNEQKSWALGFVGLSQLYLIAFFLHYPSGQRLKFGGDGLFTRTTPSQRVLQKKCNKFSSCQRSTSPFISLFFPSFLYCLGVVRWSCLWLQYIFPVPFLLDFEIGIVVVEFRDSCDQSCKLCPETVCEIE